MSLVSASNLRREYEAVVIREWGRFREDVLYMLKNNLPTLSGTIGNPGGVSSRTSLAGHNLYAQGDLRNSYYEIDIARTPSPGVTKISSFETDYDYAYYYANGRRNSETYHGYDFIEQTRRDIDRKYFSMTGNRVYIR